MTILVIGGSGSGKSAYAEQLAASLFQGEKYYLATMRVRDEEGRERVRRHRQLRKDRGFHTIEQPEAVHRALAEMKAQQLVLLECITNLAANEMFSEAGMKTASQTAEAVIGSVAALREHTAYLIVVSGNVFEDGVSYDRTTMEYIRAMGEINRRLAKMAGQVVEVVAGIPLVLKRS
ncbi:MAG: bifunctional adenosylcobinamide kinase/adenosylcobinamide-phosphate guanylyltransferase [Blautia sp.]|nr:bifunctional adenosylcobinamide kinase/adenosylcobinamide-phosphate guanylyltransferase [Blautia sp.]MCM1202134.1 bifunctional adenosylcobinamide kinase/adenosylcobinamide-phosphate guanylyltransferase [Bacteroides fragilis]